MAAALLALLLGFSLALLAAEYGERLAGYQQRDVEGMTRGGKRPKLTAPPAVLSTLARGLESDSGRLLIITWSQPRRQPGAAPFDQGVGNPLDDLFAAPDLVRVFTFAVGILALIFSFESICGERQRGTLALVFAGPVGRAEFLLGKWVGGGLSLLLALTPGLVLVVAGLALGSTWSLGAAEWLRVGAIFGVSLLYGAACLGLGLWASAWAARPATALMVALALWTVWNIGLPGLTRPVARWLAPVPGIEAVEAEKSRLRQGDFDSYLDYANACWAHDDRYIALVDRQTRLNLAWSRWSPAAAYTYAATALAATGIEDARRYRDAVVRWDRQQRRVGYNWDDEIPFRHSAAHWRTSLDEALPDMALLAAWNLLLLAAAAWCFGRYELTGGD